MQFKDANVEDTGTFEVSILYDMNMLQTIINAAYKVKLKAYLLYFQECDHSLDLYLELNHFPVPLSNQNYQ